MPDRGEPTRIIVGAIVFVIAALIVMSALSSC